VDFTLGRVNKDGLSLRRRTQPLYRLERPAGQTGGRHARSSTERAPRRHWGFNSRREGKSFPAGDSRADERAARQRLWTEPGIVCQRPLAPGLWASQAWMSWPVVLEPSEKRRSQEDAPSSFAEKPRSPYLWTRWSRPFRGGNACGSRRVSSRLLGRDDSQGGRHVLGSLDPKTIWPRLRSHWLIVIATDGAAPRLTSCAAMRRRQRLAFPSASRAMTPRKPAL